MSTVLTSILAGHRCRIAELQAPAHQAVRELATVVAVAIEDPSWLRATSKGSWDAVLRPSAWARLPGTIMVSAQAFQGTVDGAVEL